MFPVPTLSSDNYEEIIQDITTAPQRAKKAGRPLNLAEQFALRSEFRNLVRTDRIARASGLYDASVQAQTFRDG